jgi:hypothetical protein
LDARWVGFQGGEAGHELAFDSVHRVEDQVGGGLLAEEIPDVFGGVELRAIRRECGKAHVFGDDDIVGCVPAGAQQRRGSLIRPKRASSSNISRTDRPILA